MSDQSRDTSALVEALRAAVTASPELPHPSRLRLEVETALGPERSRELRREIHQVVVAAEEHLPARMTRISPLTTGSLASLSDELARSRGWSAETAERATRIWASALGFGDLATTDWPPPAHVERPPSRPPAFAAAPLAETALPPEPRRAPEPVRQVGEARWPDPPRRLRKLHERTTAGEPVLGVVQAYAGIPLPAFVAAAVALLVTLCVLLFVLPPLGAGIAAAVAAATARALVVAARYGALCASGSGLEFTPYVANMRRPKPDETTSVPWSQVRVEAGTFSVVDMGGRRIQVGPRNRAFAEAVARVTGDRP